MIAARELSRIYGWGQSRVEALRGVNLHVAQGEFVAVKGQSGSGKTTLLNLIGGLDRPTAGTVTVNGLELTRASDA
ncbi:MAG: ATP-binding cassette domain-containing protein, partial [Planctomycetes bacterium]|nr:ATP-binding cassette domain-containing protein [Planctomycetota bacterium]